MPNIELKPCPFCGGEAKLKHKGYIGGAYAYIICNECECSTPEIGSAVEYCADDKVSGMWNRRNDNAAEKP